MEKKWWTSDDVYCVPAFLQDAIDKLVGHAVSVKQLAQDLDVRVRKADYNPWGLSIAATDSLAGITRDDALVRIPQWLADHYSSLSFSHTPFNVLPFKDPESYFKSHSNKGVYVGAGLNWRVLVGAPGVSMHVVHVLAYGSQSVEVWDPTQNKTTGSSVYDVALFERAVFDQADGFWIIEKESN